MSMTIRLGFGGLVSGTVPCHRTANVVLVFDSKRHRFADISWFSFSLALSSQRAIDNLTKENTSAKKAVVSLEQGNDDLERETRSVLK